MSARTRSKASRASPTSNARAAGSSRVCRRAARRCQQPVLRVPEAGQPGQHGGMVLAVGIVDQALVDHRDAPLQLLAAGLQPGFQRPALGRAAQGDVQRRHAALLIHPAGQRMHPLQCRHHHHLCVHGLGFDSAALRHRHPGQQAQGQQQQHQQLTQARGGRGGKSQGHGQGVCQDDGRRHRAPIAGRTLAGRG
ncbi:MAG: hypothetical protein QE285_14015 [Aquabacterium sp.]|nr:hypothetical protein [Aquabacterium sp.]